MLQQENERFIEDLQELTHDVIRIFQLMDREEKSRFGVTMTQSYTLQSIQCCDKLTMNQLSERMGLATSTMTRIVDNLVRDGYIERVRDESDRRLVYVTLTPEGKKMAEQLRECTWGCFQNIADNISPEEKASVVKAIKIFLEALKCAYAESCGDVKIAEKD
jgi:DNA-binding MarR family transcriptional regulator